MFFSFTDPNLLNDSEFVSSIKHRNSSRCRKSVPVLRTPLHHHHNDDHQTKNPLSAPYLLEKSGRSGGGVCLGYNFIFFHRKKTSYVGDGPSLTNRSFHVRPQDGGKRNNRTRGHTSLVGRFEKNHQKKDGWVLVVVSRQDTN